MCIENGIITEIGNSLPSGQCIDGAGKYLIPGLVNLHVHINRRNLSRGIASTGGHETHRYPGAAEADGPTAVLSAVRNEIKHGTDFLKVMASGGLGGMPEYEPPPLSIQAKAAQVHQYNTGSLAL